jgi:hypothetical protein
MPKRESVDIEVVKDSIKYYFKNDCSQQEAYEKYGIKRTTFFSYYKIYKDELKKFSKKKMTGGNLSEKKDEIKYINPELSEIHKKENKSMNDDNYKKKDIFHIPSSTPYKAPNI